MTPLLAGPLAGCAALNSSDPAAPDNAVSDITSAIELVSAAAGVAGAAGSMAKSPPPVPLRQPAPTVVPNVGKAPSGGTSQRGAFEDCARLYASVGRPDLMQQCLDRAKSMTTAQ